MYALSLDLDALLEVQKNRQPYLMIDRATEVIPGVSAKAYKVMAPDLWFFECHFPGDPTMPGMLQIEGMVQTAALALVTLPGNKGQVCYLTNADGLKFKKKVPPGTTLSYETKILSFRRGIAKAEGIGLVDGKMACQASFMLVVPHLLGEFKVVAPA